MDNWKIVTLTGSETETGDLFCASNAVCRLFPTTLRLMLQLQNERGVPLPMPLPLKLGRALFLAIIATSTGIWTVWTRLC